MCKTITQVTVRVVLASLFVMMTLPAMSQIGQEPVEPAPETAVWKAFILAFFFAIAIAIGCLMSPKRTHQD